MATDNRSRKRRKRRPTEPSALGAGVDVAADDLAAPATSSPRTAHGHLDEEIGVTPRKRGAVNVVVVVGIVALLALAAVGLLLLTKA